MPRLQNFPLSQPKHQHRVRQQHAPYQPNCPVDHTVEVDPGTPFEASLKSRVPALAKLTTSDETATLLFLGDEARVPGDKFIGSDGFPGRFKLTVFSACEPSVANYLAKREGGQTATVLGPFIFVERKQNTPLATLITGSKLFYLTPAGGKIPLTTIVVPGN